MIEIVTKMKLFVGKKQKDTHKTYYSLLNLFPSIMSDYHWALMTVARRMRTSSRGRS